MQVQIHEPLKAFDDKPLVDPGGEPVTLADLIRQVLNTPLDGEPWTPETILRCGTLARRVDKESEPDLDDDDRSYIKTRAAKVLAKASNGPMQYLLIHEALSDPPAEPKLEAVQNEEVTG